MRYLLAIIENTSGTELTIDEYEVNFSGRIRYKNELRMWDEDKGGTYDNSTNKGRALVHRNINDPDTIPTGDDTKEKTFLYVNYDDDFGYGTQIGGSDSHVGIGTAPDPIYALTVDGLIQSPQFYQVDFSISNYTTNSPCGFFNWLIKFKKTSNVTTDYKIKIDYLIDHRRGTGTYGRHAIKSGTIDFSLFISAHGNTGSNYTSYSFTDNGKDEILMSEKPTWYYITVGDYGYIGVASSHGTGDSRRSNYNIKANISIFTTETDINVWNGTVYKKDFNGTLTTSVDSLDDIYPDTGANSDNNWDTSNFTSSTTGGTIVSATEGMNVYGTCTATNFNATSDIRLKENIEDLEDVVEKVMNLNGKNYVFKSDTTNKVHAGFIAQEVEEFIPEVVSTNDDEEKTKTINYSGIIPYLVETIKIQQNQITEQNEKISEQNEKINTLQNQINEILEKINK